MRGEARSETTSERLYVVYEVGILLLLSLGLSPAGCSLTPPDCLGGVKVLQ